VIGGHRFQALQVGSDGACGLTTRGQTYCWGDNSSDGELGDGTTTSSGVNGPQRVIGGIRFASFPVVSGEEHRCALTARGEAYCWGSNDSGQIGDGSGTGAATSELLAMGPRRVIGGLRFTSISVSEDRSCALTSSGAAYCWGDNFDGALGDGTTTDSDANGPQPVK
jgi:alpha-tubulin suppressor-like RCC1 family protein